MADVTAWGRWDCTRCGQRDISGREKRCPACGDPREQAELDAMRPPSDADFAASAISAPADLDLASSGADWSCGFCGTNNRGTETTCTSCGGSREQAASAGRVGVVGAEAAAVLPEQETGGTGHPEGRDSRGSPPSPGRRAWHHRFWRDASTGRRVAIVLGGGMLLTFLTLWWGFSTREVTGAVSRLTWHHVTQVQQWTPVTSGGWGRPAAATEVKPVAGKGERAGVKVTSCYQKHHHDQQYSCGTETYTDTESYSCGTTQECSTVNNGNGSFSQKCRSVSQTCTRNVTKTRTKTCSRPVFQEWCDYQTQAWTPARSESADGEGHDLKWVSLTSSGDLERVEQIGTYTVYSSRDGAEEFPEEVPRTQYDTYEVGEPMIFTVRNFGGTVSVRRQSE